jgi:hypothetical protein
MATKKQATNSTKATSKAPAAVPARVAKPRVTVTAPRVTAPSVTKTSVTAPRVTKTKHSKADSAVEPVVVESAIVESVVVESAAPVLKADPRQAIAKIAYGFWAARGFQAGDPVEDWIRAEKEYLQSK